MLFKVYPYSLRGRNFINASGDVFLFGKFLCMVYSPNFWKFLEPIQIAFSTLVLLRLWRYKVCFLYEKLFCFLAADYGTDLKFIFNNGYYLLKKYESPPPTFTSKDIWRRINPFVLVTHFLKHECENAGRRMKY